jgi:conjugal transfer pilus assembly protein TraA
MLTEWINGYFGRALAIAFLLVGLFMGIARQNLMACGVSIAVAFGLIITPTILDNVLSATVSEATVTIEAPAAVEAPLVLIGQPQ